MNERVNRRVAVYCLHTGYNLSAYRSQETIVQWIQHVSVCNTIQHGCRLMVAKSPARAVLQVLATRCNSTIRVSYSGITMSLD